MLLSVGSQSYANIPTLAIPVRELIPQAYDDGILWVPHGQPIFPSSDPMSISMPPITGFTLFPTASSSQYFTENDVASSPFYGTGGSFNVTRSWPANAPSTPGKSTYSYQLTDALGATSNAIATLESTNRPPLQTGMFPMHNYFVLRPDPTTPLPPNTVVPNNSWQGGMNNLGFDQISQLLAEDPDGDPTTINVSLAPLFGVESHSSYLHINGSTMTTAWQFGYDVAPGFNNVEDKFELLVTDDAGASGNVEVRVAITDQPMSSLGGLGGVRSGFGG